MVTTIAQLDGTPPTTLLGLVCSTVLAGLAAGFFFAYSANVVLAFDDLTGATYTSVMQPINESVRNAAFGAVFFGAVVVPVLTTVVLLLRGELTTTYGVVFVIGVVVYLLGTFGVTVAIHLPLNEYIATWSTSNPPSDWATVRARWARWNLVRTVAATVAFCCYVVATVGLVAVGSQ